MHTKGPWTTDVHDHDEPYQNIQIQAGCGRKICLIDIDDAPVHDYNAEQKSNARLIAAAPDLLAALEDILCGWRYIRQNPLHKTIYGVGWDRAQEKAEAAIRKAKGGRQSEPH